MKLCLILGAMSLACTPRGPGWFNADPGTTGTLYAVHGSSKNDVWVVGAQATVLHFDGSTWARVTTPVTVGLHAVYVASPSEVYVGGDAGTLLKWNGSSWSPLALNTTATVVRLGLNAGQLWALTSSGAYLMGAQGFAAMPAPGGETLSATKFWAGGDSSAWALGTFDVFRWQGSAWSKMDTGLSGFFDMVGGTGPDDVWLIGSEVLHYNGVGFETVAYPTFTFPRFQTLHARARGDLWLGGSQDSVLRYHAGAFEVVRELDVATLGQSVTHEFLGVFSGDDGDAWVVGNGGLLMHWYTP